MTSRDKYPMIRQRPLRLLLCLHEQATVEAVCRLIDTVLPGTETIVATDQEILARLSREAFDALLVSETTGPPSTLREHLVKVLTYHPDLCVVPLVTPDQPHQIHCVVDLDLPYFLTLPPEPRELNLILQRLQLKIDHLGTRQRRSTPRNTRQIQGFIGSGPAMTRLFELILRVAEDDFATVLIRGESGTGKELVAKAIHAKSRRHAHNFVPVNCAAIPDDLLESELFGHLKGSFTGASHNKTGRIQYADQGTLFLDEIGDMKPALQAKLLRVLQEKEFEPVGSLKAIPVDTRIVAATHCDLEELVKKGDFREDLYYRLSVVPIQVPPLRDRLEDIPLLLDRFIEAFTTERSREKITFSPEAVTLLLKHDWRGNVRELENLVQHMAILHGGKTIRPQDLPEKFLRHYTPVADPDRTAHDRHLFSDEVFLRERAELCAPLPVEGRAISLEEGPVDFNDLINEFETELILTAMRFTSGNKKEAARLLCLKRTTLLEKIKKKGLEGRWT